MSDGYLLSLCSEYIALVDAMRSGQYSTDDIRQFDSERQVTHNEIMRVTGYDRSVDMYRAARLIIRNGGMP